MGSRIEFGELKVNESSRKHVLECLDTNWVSMGKKVALFEQKWKELFKYKGAKAVASGTAADTACCMALYDFGATPGDEVIIPALSFIATANSVRAAGLIPVFVDIRPETMNINEELIEDAITSKTRAVMSVNLMGRPAALDVIQDICKRKGLFHISDSCESYGCRYKGKFALTYADMETSSHYTAHLIVAGEGGMVSCNDSEIEKVIDSVRSHGRQPGSVFFEHVRYGLNFKMSDLHAALALGQIEEFWHIFDRRHYNVHYIRQALLGLEDKAWFTEEDSDCINCPHGFSITLKPKYRDKIREFERFMTEASIHWKRNFGSQPHHKAFSYLNTPANAFPHARYVGDYGLHVGCHYYISSDDLGYMAQKIKEFLSKL